MKREFKRDNNNFVQYNTAIAYDDIWSFSGGANEYTFINIESNPVWESPSRHKKELVSTDGGKTFK